MYLGELSEWDAINFQGDQSQGYLFHFIMYLYTKQKMSQGKVLCIHHWPGLSIYTQAILDQKVKKFRFSLKEARQYQLQKIA